MSMRDVLDISAYLVLGPENTLGRPVEEVVKEAVKAGFTCVQIRSKVANAKEMIECCRKSAAVIRELGKENEVALLVDDRLDVVLAAREAGIKVDGIHVGQRDIPVDVCRKYLGEESVVGLSAAASELIEYVKNADTSNIDYFGVGPLHETATKPDCGMDASGKVITRTLEELKELHRVSSVPLVVGGGVKINDLPDLKTTDVEGFFVVSAVAGAENPYAAAKAMVAEWKK